MFFFQVEDNNTIKQGRNTLFDGVIALKCLVFQVEDNNTIKQGRNTLFDGVIALKCLVSFRLKTITPSNKVEKLCLMVLLSCFFFQVEDNNTVNVILLNKKFKKSIVLLNSQTEDNNTVKQGRNTLFDGVIVLKCLVF